MVCPNCFIGNMIQHPEEIPRNLKWLKCTTCTYCCKEEDLVSYYKKPKSERIKPISKRITEEERRAGSKAKAKR